MALFRMFSLLCAPEGELDTGAPGELDDEDLEGELDDETAEEPIAAAPPKIVPMPSSAVGKIRREERARGERLERARLERVAREAGFDSHDSLVEAARAAKTRQPRRREAAAPEQTELETARARIAALESEAAAAKQASRKQRINAKIMARRAERLEATLETKEVEHEMTLIAVRSGVKDVDYALQLARRNISKLPERERGDWDPAEYFGKTLKAEAVYLYESEDVAEGTPASILPGATPEKTAAKGPIQASPPPANPGGANPPAPGPGNPPPPAPPTGGKPEGVVDARTMPQAEYHALLRSHGLAVPGGSLPI